MSLENSVELVGNMHMHTPYSDGTKWHADIANDAIAAGLDFIIVTDHNIWVDGMEGWYHPPSTGQAVLCLMGQEINALEKINFCHFLVVWLVSSLLGLALS